jgi:methionyl-tRNA formyltransferase
MDGRIPREAFPSRPRIVFMGTPQFSVPTLERIIRERYEVLGVVTQPDRPKGRGQRLSPSPVKVVAQENHLHVLQPEQLDDRFLEAVNELQPDLLVVVAFGQIIPGKVLRSAMWGGINIHASLLPRYRGSAPIQWAIINNEKTTGLTTMFMDEGMDTGPIILQQEVDILEGETAGELHDRLSSLAPELLMKTIQGLNKGTVAPRKQDETLATYAPKLTKEQGLIDWSRPAEQICGLIRGLDPWPGAFTPYQGGMMKLFGCLTSHHEEHSFSPGRIRNVGDRGLEIETGKGCVIVSEIQVPGKKRLSAVEFFRGSALHTGSILGRRE